MLKQVNKNALEKKFDEYFFNMQYDEALEVVGAMEQSHISNVRYYRMLVYYETGKFEKVRHALKDKHLGLQERELYLGALAELGLREELFKASKTVGTITAYCYFYIMALLKDNDKEGFSKDVYPEEIPTFFMRRYAWFIAKQMANIYVLNEERLLMKRGEMSEEVNRIEHILRKKIETVRIVDEIRESVIDDINSDNHISREKILYFPLKYCADSFPPRMIRPFTQLYDIINYLEIERNIGSESLELDLMVEYFKDIEKAVIGGNEYAIELLIGIYIDVHHFHRYTINDTTSICDIIYDQLQKYAPYALKEIGDHEYDGKIKECLSERGCLAYDAARWQFDRAVSEPYGIRDAGMICLSYSRMLELEINEKILIPLCQSVKPQVLFDSILEELGVSLDDLDHKKEWEDIIQTINKVDAATHKGLTLGELRFFFNTIKQKDGFKKKSKDALVAKRIREELEVLLTEEGQKAVRDGLLSKMIRSEVGEKFRNPPAHTRYVGIEVALECKEYVEEALLKLKSYCR